MPIIASVVIKEIIPGGPLAPIGGTKTEIVLQFEVAVSTLADVERRVADVIRSGLAVHPSKEPMGASEYRLPPTVADSGDVPGSWLPKIGGKHSGNCVCSACAEPSPEEVKPVQIPDDAFEPPIGRGTARMSDQPLG